MFQVITVEPVIKSLFGVLFGVFKFLYDRPFYLFCPDVLSLVGEHLSGDGRGLLNHI